MYINQSETDNLDKGLGLFIEAFRPYVVSILTKRFGDDWDERFSQTISYKQKENWDKDLRKGIKPINLIDFQFYRREKRKVEKMSEELQLGKYEFIPYKFEDEYEKLLKELELLSLNDKEREKRRKEILKRLANLKRSSDAISR